VLVATEEELRLLDLLTPEYWNPQAKARGLRGVNLDSAKLTESGVVAVLKLDGRDMLKELRAKHQAIRAMLDVLDEHLSDLSPGGRSSRVLFAVRTRYITDELDMFWHPDITTLGLDTVTGEEVDVPRNERLLVGGASGSGKSWSTRALMARAVVHPDEELGGFIDGKGEEATVWRGICTCAVTHEEIIEMIEREHARMEDRATQMAKLGISKWDLKLGPRRLIPIDEGYSVLQAVLDEDKRRGKAPRGDEEYAFLEGPDKSVMQKLTELSSQGRSREIIIMWMTQNPLRSGDDRGITSGIRTNFDFSFCLRVNTPQNTDTVLGPGAGVEPHFLPRGPRFRGHGYLNVHGPNLVRTWTVTDEMVALLAHPDHGRGKYPRDVALRALRSQPQAVWTPALLATHTGCGATQASRFLRSFTREGLIVADGENFRLAV
jgi:S-DNA-T family DNA segregation ATPase FtsK/SpoIIIE